MKIKNTTSQNKAFEEISNKLHNIVETNMVWDNEVSLYGAAGTGKTYLTTKLVKKLKSDYSITITAPTHKALQVLRENLLSEDIQDVDTKTIQSFLNLRLVTDFDKGIQKFEPLKSKEKDISKTDVLIVDESSMVSYELYEYILKAIEEYRVKSVFFVGDEYQLLPIDSDYNQIFNIKNKYKLDKIIRQAQDSYIINIATKARNIIKSKQYISVENFFKDDLFKEKVQFFDSKEEFYDDFCSPENWVKKDKIIAGFTNKTVEKHNRIIRSRFWEAQNILNPVTLLKGEKVIFQQANVIDEKVVHQNSDIVEICEACKKFEKTLQIYYWDCRDLSDKPFKVIDPDSKGRFEMILNKLVKSAKSEKNYAERIKKWALFFDIKDTFVDVKYIYASTIHKLQGSTYKTVYIDLTELENMSDKDMMFRLIYVAITRASIDIKVLLPNGGNKKLVNYQDSILNSLNSQFNILGINV